MSRKSMKSTGFFATCRLLSVWHATCVSLIEAAPRDSSFFWRNHMLYYAVVFFVIALIAGVLGFGGIAGAAAGIAKILFFVFLILFVVSLIMGRRVKV